MRPTFRLLTLFCLGMACLRLEGLEPGASTPPSASVSMPIPMVIAQAQDRARNAEARGDIPNLVAALNDEADGHLRAHEFDQAEKLRLRVLHLQEEHTGRNSLPVSEALLNLGWFYGNMARYEEAQGALDRCLDLREQRLGTEAPPVAEVLNALGALEENRSNFTLAEAFYQQAIAIQEKAPGLQSPVTATTWNNLATLYWITGDYAQAEKYFMQALAVRERLFGPESVVVAATLNNLALLDSSLGDYDEAGSYFQRVLRIRTMKLTPDNPATITTLFQLGLLYSREGDDTRAQPLLERAVAAQQKIYLTDHPDVARSLFQLGLLYDRRKLYAKAEPLLTQSLEMRRRMLGTDHPEYAASVAALARHDHAQGRLAEAKPLYQEALEIDEETLGKNHPETPGVAADLACLNLESGQRDEATRLAREVAESQQHMLNSVFTFAPERQRLDFEKTIEPCDLPAALGDADLLAEVVLRTKGVVLDSLLEDEATARAAKDPDVRELMEKQRLLSAQLLRGQDEASGAGNPPEAASGREKLETEERQLEANLAEKGIGSGKTRRALATEVPDVRDALPSDAALVEYVAYNRYLGRLGHEPAYGAVVLTHDAPTRWIALGSGAEINARLRIYQKYMRVRVREAALSEVLHGLYQSICQPVLAGLPGTIHRLVISPDGDLDFVSFATLLDNHDQFLGQDFELNYVASGRDLLPRHEGAPRDKRLVIFADPDYAHSAKGGSKKADRDDDFFTPLPGTEREAVLLQQEAVRAGIGVQIYRGTEASEANLCLQHAPYIIHLATHGLYLSGEDAPHLPPPANPDENAQQFSGQPMSRSLLALAGASVTLRKWKAGLFPPTENDGLITAQKVASLDLDRTWLVVLSACDSGSGEASQGEGVLGLRRGFAEAGAENLLMTLWTVDDSGTADLMQAFYREALHSGDAPGALARVQSEQLDGLRRKSGLSEAVRQAGPFILSY